MRRFCSFDDPTRISNRQLFKEAFSPSSAEVPKLGSEETFSDFAIRLPNGDFNGASELIGQPRVLVAETGKRPTADKSPPTGFVNGGKSRFAWKTPLSLDPEKVGGSRTIASKRRPRLCNRRNQPKTSPRRNSRSLGFKPLDAKFRSLPIQMLPRQIHARNFSDGQPRANEKTAGVGKGIERERRLSDFVGKPRRNAVLRKSEAILPLIQKQTERKPGKDARPIIRFHRLPNQKPRTTSSRQAGGRIPAGNLPITTPPAL